MNIVVDENVPHVSVEELRAAGHILMDVRGSSDQGMSDDDLWQRAQAAGALLISTDKGFAGRRSEYHYGLRIVRLRQPTMGKIHDRIMRAFARYGELDWRGLTVVMRDRVQSVTRARPPV